MLSIDITISAHGARPPSQADQLCADGSAPEDQVEFLGAFSTAELKSLYDALNQALALEADRLIQ